MYWAYRNGSKSWYSMLGHDVAAEETLRIFENFIHIVQTEVVNKIMDKIQATRQQTMSFYLSIIHQYTQLQEYFSEQKLSFKSEALGSLYILQQPVSIM